MKGVVKWYNPRKGFGFIVGEDGKDVFIHHSALPENISMLNEGEELEYEIEDTPKGPNAKNIKKA
jgi:CspA family cold shock protein